VGFWDLKTRLWQRGRVSLWFEPRDLWPDYIHGEGASYLVVIPMFPLRIERDRPRAEPR
jgi:hypothetical protein